MYFFMLREAAPVRQLPFVDRKKTICDINGMPDPFLQILSAGSQLVTSPVYCYDNRYRGSEHVIIQYTCKGSCHFRLGEETHPVTEGKAFVALPPEDSAYWFSSDGAGPYELEWVAIGGDLAVSLGRCLRQRHGPLPGLQPRGEALFKLRRILRLFSEAAFEDRLQASELAYSFLLSALREQEQKEQARDPVLFCYHYLHNHHRSPFNIKWLAADAGVSREHLSREFKRRYGKGPAAMLRELRLATAKSLLLGGGLGLEEVARSSGFGSARNLSRLLGKR
jgi:AraC-like DNA-binding protein